jgi:ribosomal protein L22
MLNFLHSSKAIAREVAVVVQEAQRAQRAIKKRNIKEAIEKLKDIASEESQLYQKITRNQEGLAQEVLEQEVRKTMRIAQHIIQLLERDDMDNAREWLDILIHREINVQKWIRHRIAVRAHEKKLARSIKRILKKYVKKGMIAIELFNGERSDIMEALAELVGQRGHVYGIDTLNPFEGDEQMAALQALPQVDLITARFPDMPVPEADVIVVREFHYVNQAGDKKFVYAALDSKLKKKGFLIMLLNYTEYHGEVTHQRYQKAVSQFLSNYRRIEWNELELVFQKQ